MQNKKDNLIKKQRLIVRIFWSTVVFLFGFLFAVWQTYELAHLDVMVSISEAFNLIIAVILFLMLWKILVLLRINDRRNSSYNHIHLEVDVIWLWEKIWTAVTIHQAFEWHCRSLKFTIYLNHAENEIFAFKWWIKFTI